MGLHRHATSAEYNDVRYMDDSSHYIYYKGTNVYNVTSSSSTVRAYAFSGKPPSLFAAVECVAASQQLLLINLAPRTNTTVKFTAAAYTSWASELIKHTALT